MNYANMHSHSDITPFEIIETISDKTLVIREMEATKDDGVKMEFHVGGFSAHCSNQRQQKWFITSDETNRVFRIRLGVNGWKDAHGNRFKLSDKPVYFYDYNF
tara:strand:- start:237 stop:545 length:309 start_codon:yes stop_codon:yes gene_type:complete